MNHSPTKRKTSQGLLHSPWLAILFTLLLIASLVPLAINFSHAAAAQETALSETTEDATAVVDEATAVNDLNSDDAKTQPSDQVSTDEPASTTDSQETPDNTTTTDEEPSFVERITEFFKGVFKTAEQKTAEEQKTTVGTFFLEQKTTVNGKPASETPSFQPRPVSYNWSCTFPGDSSISGSFTLIGDKNETSDSFKNGTVCDIFFGNQAPTISNYTAKRTTISEGKNITTGTVRFTIKAGEQTIIKVEDIYTKNGQPTPPQPKGESSFVIHKQVSTLKNKKPVGNSTLLRDKEFKFTWKCTLPNNGEEKSGSVTLMDKGFKKIEQIPAGSSCTVTEDIDSAQVPEYEHKVRVTLDTNQSQETNTVTFTTTSSVKPTSVTFTNTYSQDDKPKPPNPKPPVPGKGSFTLKKEVKGLNQKDKKFDFIWQCYNNNNNLVANGSTMLKDGETFTVPDLPLDSQCRIKEKDVDVEGFTHSLQWFTNDEKKAEENGAAVVSPREKEKEPLVVKAVNTYTPVDDKKETGQFTLEKKVVGLEDKDKNKEFEFTWSCTDDANKTTRGKTKLKNDGKHTVTGLPLDSTCKVSETNTDIPGYTHSVKWKTNGEDKVAPNGIVSVDPRKADKKPPVVTAVNTYVKEGNPVPPKPETGTFTLKKEVKGLEQKDKNKEFEFNWSCRSEEVKEPVKGSTKLKNGATFKVDNLPLGSTCLVSEKNATVAGFKHSLQWLTNGERTPAENLLSVSPRSTSEAELVVTAVNTYIKDTKPAPTTTSSSKTTTPTTSATSSMTPTTSASSTSSVTTTSSATSTTSSAKPTTTTSSTEPIAPTTTGQFPPIIPIPIPIPVPPAPFPPAPHPAPAPAPGNNSNPATPHHGGTNVTTQPQQNSGKNTTPAAPGQTNKGKGLANTGASVIWLALVALLLAAVGGFITYRGRAHKKD
ncbi:DUF5979 domain-containing protein [Corynebacterium kutscheri]|uniref:DUF5979 domain-containing protein n=1 Tax=Corynebacterium kutscheri TaxID=35755 RepID=UPI0037C03018